MNHFLPPLFTIDTLLNQIGTFLQDSPKRILEWSLTARAGKVSDRDRVTCWVEADKEGKETFSGFARLLEVIHAPTFVLDKQQDAAPISIRQGISVALLGGDVEWRLYLHTRSPGSRSDQYRSYRWRASEDIQEDTYRFYYAPETLEGDRPEQLVHPAFIMALQTLTQYERWQKMSGFWLRYRGEKVLQVDLTFPWHPRLEEFTAVLDELSLEMGVTNDWLKRYGDYPIRHLAFSGQGKGGAAFTVYFSAPLRGEWPTTLDELKKKVFDQGLKIEETLERDLFGRIPIESEAVHTRTLRLRNTSAQRATGVDIGSFYDSENVNIWKQVLGPKMHYHFGMFETTDMNLIDDSSADEAFNRAVSDLYPFIPAGGRVYDIGCGWGGTMLQLIDDLGCQVEGITASRSQFRHCASLGLRIRHGDVESTWPAGYFDCMVMMESLCHVWDKVRLLKLLRLLGKKLIIRDHCQDASPSSVNFGGTMLMNSSTKLREMVEEAGWKITHWRNRRAESMPSVWVWHRRLQDIPPGNDVHLETLREFCARVVGCADEWAVNNPLIEMVAE